MDRRTLPLSALRAFESAANHLHLGLAGKEMGVTHGAISHHIRALEEQLGVKLFIRAHNKLALTSSGRTLHDAVKRGFDQIVEGTHHLNPDALTGSLVIGCTQTIAISWATRHICEFQKKYPSIQIHVKEIQPRQAQLSSDLDIAICYGKPEASWEEVTRLASPLLYPVCSPALIQKSDGSVKPKEILRYTLLHDDQVSWRNWFAARGITSPDLSKSIYFPNTSQALTAARLGYGVALCNTFETLELINNGHIIRVNKHAIAEEEENEYYLFCRQKKQPSLKLALFKQWIIDACAQNN